MLEQKLNLLKGDLAPHFLDCYVKQMKAVEELPDQPCMNEDSPWEVCIGKMDERLPSLCSEALHPVQQSFAMRQVVRLRQRGIF
jgi:hypothetical protein